MKIVEHLARAKNPLFSYEIVPPPRGRSIKDIVDIVEAVAPLNPPWIDVTTHAPSAHFRERADGGFERRTLRKRPGTLGICGVIQNRFKIDTVAHLLCLGFSREETEDALIELSFLGIHNVLALRGDAPNIQKELGRDRTANSHASELVTQVKALQKGQFLDQVQGSQALDFCVGVAGYPEKHFEAPSLKSDINFLKKKVDAGADFIVTQMFFDNEAYFDFVKRCREAGITVPIIPGLKVLKSSSQMSGLSKHFHIDLPEAMVGEIEESPDHVAEIGRRWADKQVQGLLDFGVPAVHFYILNDASTVVDIVKKAQK